MSRKATSSNPEGRWILKNRRAYHDYEILETLECGIVLQGTEVKSLREKNVSFGDSYAVVQDGELFLKGLHIAEYKMAKHGNHAPTRTRKLLAHKRQILKLGAAISERGMTLIPLALYWKEGRCKVEIGLARGKKLHDKRETLKRREAERDRRSALRKRQKR